MNAMITRASLQTDADPGHGGISSTFSIEPEGAGYRVCATLSRWTPMPGERLAEPLRHTEQLARDAAQVRDFLDRLYDVHAVHALRDLDSAHAMLHPTFHTFHFEDDAGQVQQLRYRIECGKHPDDRYRDLVREFETFFDKAQRVAQFVQAQERRPTTRSRPWWKLW